ncbi:thiamine phosphate synthase [Candidatus Omnitrophota bacterium]
MAMRRENLLYVIIDRSQAVRARRNLTQLVQNILRADPDFIQFRFKNEPTSKILAEAISISRQVKMRQSTKFIVNDRVDVACAAGADGVHLGREDIPCLYARKIMGKKAIVGKTVHTLKELEQAYLEPINYVSVGPVFKTGTKPRLKPLGIKKTKRFVFSKNHKGIYNFVIGGIKPLNVPQLTKEKITNIAICSAILLSKNPYQATKEINAIIKFC